MPSRTITQRLRAGEVLLLDGATGSELHARGANVSIGSTPQKLATWSATVNVDRPDLVRDVHADYLRLGADIITSNNFWTSRPRLAMIGRGEEWERYVEYGAEWIRMGAQIVGGCCATTPAHIAALAGVVRRPRSAI